MNETIQENSIPAPPSEKPRFHWPSAVQLGLSVLGMLLLWTYALFTLLAELMNVGSEVSLGGEIGLGGEIANGASPYVGIFGVVFAGVLLIPSAYHSLARLAGRQVNLPAWVNKAGQVFQAGSILVALGVIAIGYLVNQNNILSTFLLPPLHALAASLPILWLFWLASRKQPKLSPQRAWGVFGCGLVLGPMLILIAEFMAIILIVLLSVIYVMMQPELADTIMSLSDQFRYSQDPEFVFSLISSYLVSPGVILGIVGFAAVVVPLIEELLKPIGVWLLAGRNLTPQEGFVAGLVSGAGYALFENLTLGANGANEWAVVISVRAITSLIHIFTTGLMGWALASAWQKRKYIRLGLAYLAAVCVHGLWNGLLVLAGFSIIPILLDVEAVLPPYMLGISFFTLIVLTLGLFAIIAFSGRIVRPVQPELSEASPESAD